VRAAGFIARAYGGGACAASPISISGATAREPFLTRINTDDADKAEADNARTIWPMFLSAKSALIRVQAVAGDPPRCAR
jgi:hypothetical protein